MARSNEIDSRWPVSPFSVVNGKPVESNTDSGESRPTRRSEVPTDLSRVMDPEFVGITVDDVDTVVNAAYEAMLWLQGLPDAERTKLLASWLRAAADAQEGAVDEIAAIASLEVALPLDTRLKGIEGPRASNQLRLIADAAERGTWRQARIAPGAPGRFDTRSIRLPWGVTVQFGPDTFPLAFPGVNGAMRAGAVAAGNADIPVSSWNTLATSARLFECWDQPAADLDLHPGLRQFLHIFDVETATALVSHPRVALTGFTGGVGFGKTLSDAAMISGNMFLGEYGGPNGIFIGSAALADRPRDLGVAFAGPCTTMGGTGLFCNSAKFCVIFDGNGSTTFDSSVVESFAAKQTSSLCLVSSTARDNYNKSARLWREHFGEPAASSDGEPDPNTAQVRAHVFQIDGETALRNWFVLEDAPFGPCAVRILAKDVAQMEQIAEKARALACARWYLEADKEALKRVFILMDLATGRTVGKLGGTTAGIRYDTDAVVHTGPFPASNAPWFSTVGPENVLHAFSRPHGYQDFVLTDLPSSLLGG